MSEKRLPGNTRKTGKEQFYTPSDTAAAVVSRLATFVDSFSDRVVLEPAGGTGAFIDAARAHGVRDIVSWDIEPHHSDVRKGDFLRQSLDIQGAVTVSNPPFGRNNSLAVPFFNHAAQASEYICFVVPRSWRKWSVINRLDERFELIDDYDLDINYVDVNGHDAYAKNNLRTCVQTWRRGTQLRPAIRVEDRGYVQRSNPLEADISMTVFGYGCGTVKTEFPRVPNTTQMFLKVQSPAVLKALAAIDVTRFSLNTAYTEALSLPELNYLLNEYFDTKTRRQSSTRR